jgi:putative ABC transport system permease protein
VLTRKLIRELYAQKWQYSAVVLMLVLGVAFFGASYIAYQNLHSSYEYSYDLLDFEDAGIRFHAAPKRAVDRVLAVPGIAAAEGRLQEDVSVEIPGAQKKRLVGRIISVPGIGEPSVNRYKLERGSGFTTVSAREVLIERKFAEHHRLQPGDSIEIHRMGDRARFRIAGIVSSPEYIYVVQSKQDLLPMPDTFGVMFMPEDVLGSLVGKRGLINEIRFRTVAKEVDPKTLRAVSNALSEYRPEDPFLREDQPSHQLLTQDLEGFRLYSILFPLFFLSVAAVTVYALLLRLVNTQRTIIGLLRSLGVTRFKIVMHYLGSSLLIGLIAGIIGTVVGLWLSQGLTRYYLDFIAVPHMKVEAPTGPLAVGIIAGMGACLVAGFFPARAAAAISPADAMRPMRPQTIGAIRLDRILPKVPLLWRIPFRNVFRQPKRSLSTLFGIASGLSLILTAQGLLDSMNAALDLMVEGVFREDLRLGFIGYGSERDVNAVRSMRGVIWAEGTLDLPMDFRRGDKTYTSILTGIQQGGKLFGLQDEAGDIVELGKSGAVFGPTLQRRLDLESGHSVMLSLPKSEILDEPQSVVVRAAGFNWEPLGTVAYMPKDEVWRLFRNELSLPPGAVTSVRAKIEPEYEAEVRRKMESLPNAGAVFSVGDLRKMIDDLTDTSVVFFNIMLMFGAVLAFSVVFNMVTINVLERSQEVATMRTIGISHRQIIGLITFENFILASIGVVIGLPLGRLFVEYFILAAQTEEQMELFSMRLVVEPTSYVISAGIIFAVVFLSQLPSLHHIMRLDLAKAVKERSG